MNTHGFYVRLIFLIHKMSNKMRLLNKSSFYPTLAIAILVVNVGYFCLYFISPLPNFQQFTHRLNNHKYYGAANSGQVAQRAPK